MKVRNRHSVIRTWFGGSCCVPSACRRRLVTIINRMKQVVMIRIEGARLKTVSTTIRLIVELRPPGETSFSG